MNVRLKKTLARSTSIICLTCLALNLLPGRTLYAAKTQATGTGTELFQTREFRGSLKALKAWQQVITKAQRQIQAFRECPPDQSDCTAAAQSWQQLQEAAMDLNSLEQLKLVNQFFNRWPYRLDLEIYHQSDYWATPKEFMQFSGDCEDYAITKYFALRQLGYPATALRIVVLKDGIRNLAHAVLAVYEEERVYILDNISDLVLPQERYRHYQPQYSVNEKYRWAHIKKYKGFLKHPKLIKGPENAN